MAIEARKQVDNLMEKPDPGFEFPPLHSIIEGMKVTCPWFNDAEKIEGWYKNITRTGYLDFQRDLIKTNEDGTPDLSLLIAHNHFVEHAIRTFKCLRSAGEMLRINILKDFSAAAKAKITEEDKKYKPQFKEREATDKIRQTAEEKKIQEFIKLGMSRESAEKIVFKAKPESTGQLTVSDKARSMGLSQEAINKLILGK